MSREAIPLQESLSLRHDDAHARTVAWTEAVERSAGCKVVVHEVVRRLSSSRREEIFLRDSSLLEEQQHGMVRGHKGVERISHDVILHSKRFNQAQENCDARRALHAEPETRLQNGRKEQRVDHMHAPARCHEIRKRSQQLCAIGVSENVDVIFGHNHGSNAIREKERAHRASLGETANPQVLAPAIDG